MNALRLTLLLGVLGALPPASQAQTIERFKPGDISLDCGAISREQTAMDPIIAAGDPNANATGRAVGGAAANVGGQIAGAALAQGLNNMFGGLGGLFSRSAGQVAQQVAQEQMKPDAAAVQRATEAKARKDFLTRLASARECRADDPVHAGKALDAQAFLALAGAPAVAGAGPADSPAAVAPLNLASVQQVLAQPVAPLATAGVIDSNLNLKGKKFYIAEFRVLFDVGGKVTASTRAAYFGGTNYGATRSTIQYKIPAVDVAAFQAITDRVWEDFRQRLAAAGVQPEDTASFVRTHGAIYEATVEPSRPGAPVLIEKNLGYAERQYLVMAPTGMKLHDRGFAGLGAGNIGKRMDFSRGNLEGLSISVAVNLAALESSGSGSSLFQRGSSVNASEGMQIAASPDAPLVQTHVGGTGARVTKAIAVNGSFANFREVGGYNTATDGVAQSLAFLQNRAGIAANNSNRSEMVVDLNGPATAQMAVRGLATINQALVDALKAGL